MNPFRLTEPQTLKQAVAILGAADLGTRPIAGGTAMMLMMKTGIFQPEQLVSLRNIEPRYSSIEMLSDGNLRIGAMTPLRKIETSPEVAKTTPVVTRALRRLSNVRVRNVATLGGHLAHGDPHLDLPPVLIALGASLSIIGSSGERTINAEDLFQGYLETTLAPDELIAEVTIPAQGARKASYIKHTTRSADDWPALGIATVLEMTGNIVTSARIAIGAATQTPHRLASPEALLAGQSLDDKILQAAADAAANEADVGSDARGSAAYKRELIRVFAARAIRQAIESSRWRDRLMVAGSTTTVGHSYPRMEGHAKVTGQAEYVYNMRVPNMLHAKVCRSTLSHGMIRSIDTSEASALAGVHHVITGDDILKVLPEPFYGPAFHDQPILALKKVRHFGEPIAVVLAADPHIAESAAQLIKVDYEELSAVYNEVDAMTSDVIVHDELKPAGAFADLKHLAGRRDTNIALDFHLRHGDADNAFAVADHVFEHTFTTQQTMHTPFEPMVALADVRNDHATIYCSTQSPSFIRYEIARLLGWPESKVRIKTSHLGGGFGAKVYVKTEALAMALSLIVHRPVRLALTMEEQFYTITKHPSTFKISSAVSKDGRVTGRKCEVWWNGGAYADIGPRVTQKSGFTAAGPYDIDNVSIDSYALYTNRPPAGALRGFGIPQLVWAYESHTDMIARELGIDAVDFRKRNILRNGRPQAVGTIVEDGEFEAVLDDIADRMGWGQAFDKGSGSKRRGRGVAIGFKASISPTTSSAIVNVSADGSCIVYCSTVDMGQGSDTAMAQIASEVLDIPIHMIRVVNPDTDVTPYDMSTLGSRSTFHMGHAVRLAATDAKNKLIALAEEVGMPEGSNAPLPELFVRKFGMRAGNIVGTANYMPDYTPPNYETGQSTNATPFWMIGGTGAEVEVDMETGQLRILRLVNVCDIGKPINPLVVETQISGAAVMQLGFTLTEDMIIENGQLTNPSLADYKIPGIFDMPDTMENGFIEAEQRNGPFGAKGAGKSGTFGISPAIANAIDDAVGVRITEMPIKAEAIFRALREKQGRPLEDQ